MSTTLKKVSLLVIVVLLASACVRTPELVSEGSPGMPVQDSAPAAPGTQQPRFTELPEIESTPTSTAAQIEPEEIDTELTQEGSIGMENDRMNIQVGDQVLTAAFADNSSAFALKEALSKGPITVDMRDYGSMEKVGSLGMELPRNDEQITTEAGDIILYQGNALVIYYAPNSWNFTRLGKITDLSGAELKGILGDGNVTVTLSLPQE